QHEIGMLNFGHGDTLGAGGGFDDLVASALQARSPSSPLGPRRRECDASFGCPGGLGTHRQLQAEGRTPTYDRLDPETAAMHFDNLFGNRQSEPGATLSPGTRAVHLMELVEDALTLLILDARAGVADAHDEAAILITGRNANLPRVRELDGIADEIEQHLG